MWCSVEAQSVPPATGSPANPQDCLFYTHICKMQKYVYKMKTCNARQGCHRLVRKPAEQWDVLCSAKTYAYASATKIAYPKR